MTYARGNTLSLGKWFKKPQSFTHLGDTNRKAHRILTNAHMSVLFKKLVSGFMVDVPQGRGARH